MNLVESTADRTAREAVYEVFADQTLSVEERVDRALSIGVDRLGVEFGFLTEIEDGTQRIAQVAGESVGVEPGATCSVERAYCRRTVERETTLCVQAAGLSPDVADGAYDEFGFSTYIGTVVSVGDDISGTVCFAADSPRREPFPETDQLFVELLGRLLGQALERRAHEETLRERNRQLVREKNRVERIANTAFDLLFEIDLDLRLTYVSSAPGTLLGYDSDAVTGDRFTDYLPESSIPTARSAFESVADGDRVRNLNLTAVNAAGDETILEVNATPVFEDGTVVEIQGVARDVTERHEREAELRLKTRAIDDADTGITIADATHPDTPLIAMNDAFTTLTGYSRAEMLGRNCRVLQGPATDEAAVETLREAVHSQHAAEVDLVNYRRDGQPFWNHVRIVPVEDDDGSVSHLLGFQEDATDRVRTNRLIELLNRVLRHTLRNELNILGGYAELLSDPDAADRLDIDPARVIRETVDGLVSVSGRARELEAIARQTRDPVRLDVDRLLSVTLAGFDEQYPDSTVTADVDLPSDQGICAGFELQRALEELVENALLHDPDPETSVTVSVRGAADTVVITVSDDGPGIPAVEASAIQAGKETALVHGNGLGLWLVNWIVTRYGGSFQIRPAEPADAATGTVATVRLPRIDADESVADAVRPHTTLFQ